MKICLAASAGGHLTELLCISQIWNNRKHFFVTTNENTLDLLTNGSNVYIVSWGNRNYPVLIAKLLYQCIKIILIEHPDVVISTGAASGCILAILTKLTGGKVIWIDTISHPDYLSLSGRIVRPFTDIFLVQWPELVDKYPGTTYAGTVM